MKITIDISDEAAAGLQTIVDLYNQQNKASLTLEEYAKAQFFELYATSLIDQKKADIVASLDGLTVADLDSVKASIPAKKP